MKILFIITGIDIVYQYFKSPLSLLMKSNICEESRGQYLNYNCKKPSSQKFTYLCFRRMFPYVLGHSVASDSLQPHELQPSRLLGSWNFPGKYTGVGCHFLLQGIFLTQRLNPGLPHWQADSFYHQASYTLIKKKILILNYWNFLS